MKLSEHNSTDHHNGEADDFLNGGSDALPLPQRRTRIAPSTSGDRRRITGMPPTSPPVHPQGTPSPIAPPTTSL